MSKLLQTGNVVFHGVHLGIILWTLVGWAFGPVRTWHLALCAATALSWLLNKALTGRADCPITQGHWWIRKKLGYPCDENYVALLLRTMRVAQGLRIPILAGVPWVLASTAAFSAILILA